MEKINGFRRKLRGFEFESQIPDVGPGLTWIVDLPEWHFRVIGLNLNQANPESINVDWPELWIDLKYAFTYKY